MVLLQERGAERHRRALLHRNAISERPIAAWPGVAHDGRLDRRVRVDDTHANVMVLLQERGTERQRRALLHREVSLNRDSIPERPIAVWPGVAHDGRLDR